MAGDVCAEETQNRSPSPFLRTGILLEPEHRLLEFPFTVIQTQGNVLTAQVKYMFEAWTDAEKTVTAPGHRWT